MLPVIMKLLTMGPTVLRGVGSLLGGKKGAVAEKIANAIDGVADVASDKQQAITNVIEGLSPEEQLAFAELQKDLAQIEERREKNKLDQELGLVQSDERRHLAEMNQSDVYTKRTRPKIARESWQLSAFYALSSTFIFPLIQPFIKNQLPTFDAWVFGAIAAPALTYMGVRGLERWKAGGAKK